MTEPQDLSVPVDAVAGRRVDPAGHRGRARRAAVGAGPGGHHRAGRREDGQRPPKAGEAR